MGEVTVYAPGSMSNLGPGFDCLGLAFTGRGDHVTARAVDEPGVRVAWVSDPRIPSDAARNTAALAASAVLRRSGAKGGLELRVEKGLPLAGGQGGSAASAVAGAVAADLALGTALPREQVMAAALEAEASLSGLHGDNVLPSLLGGAVLVLGLHPPRYATIHVDERFVFVLVTPDYLVETAKARAVLPAEIGRTQAVAQAARLGGLLQALARGDAELLAACLRDEIAEPRRAPLYPGYPEARAAGVESGAVGVVVSGAGPTVVAVCAEARAGAVGEAMVEAYRRVGHGAASHRARVDAQGARAVAR